MDNRPKVVENLAGNSSNLSSRLAMLNNRPQSGNFLTAPLPYYPKTTYTEGGVRVLTRSTEGAYAGIAGSRINRTLFT
jgi:hypothetical protein